MKKLRKYIIFRADWKEEKGATNVGLPTWGMTWILGEHFDSSGKPAPIKGYRLTEYLQVEQFKDPSRPIASTHSRVGDWEVNRVEEYKTTDADSDFEEIVICYCQYSPIISDLKPLPGVRTPELQEAAQ